MLKGNMVVYTKTFYWDTVDYKAHVPNIIGLITSTSAPPQLIIQDDVFLPMKVGAENFVPKAQELVKNNKV